MGLLAVNSNLIDPPIAIMLVMMFLGSSEILQSMPSQFDAWDKTSFSANRLTSLVNVTERQNAVTLNQINSIEVVIQHNLKVALSQRKDITFKISSKQLLNIKGRSGSGKSTVANFLIGADTTENNNKVIINNKTILSDIATAHWYKKICYLEQSNSLLAGTLGYNLALGLNSISARELWSVLKTVELFVWANALPQGLDSWLGEAGGKVSGGQARRICLARLLLRDPQLVILDEPFNGIDKAMAVRIWTNIYPWISSRMSVLLTHERPVYLTSDQNALELCLDDDE
jgi:ATP-binding cassette subfamily C protein CydC